MRAPTPDEVRSQLELLSPLLVRTPTIEWGSLRSRLVPEVAPSTIFKLELFQYSGSFKMRGALSVIDMLSVEAKRRGIVCGTGGNHGIAVAAAAAAIGQRDGITIPTTVVVPETMNPFRREILNSFKATVITTPTISDVLAKMTELAEREELVVIHPFENPTITLGTATLGLEFVEQAGSLDAVIVPVGGGGLASGVASIVKQLSPKTMVYGVEPESAASLSHSLQQGRASRLPNPPKSIADSLCAPCSEPYSFAVCQRYIDEVVLVSENEIARALRTLFEHLKLAVEPAGAIATAALMGPLRERCSGLKVGVIVCGANIDPATHYSISTSQGA
jgi:threonine dehydratase